MLSTRIFAGAVLPLWGRTAVLIGMAAVLAGCGGSGLEVAPARGKVVCGGKPVSVGSVMLTPIAEGAEPGKPATAAVQPDGTFVLSTYGEQDGAVLGKHRIIYSPPEGIVEDEEEAAFEEGSPEEARLNAERARKLRELTRNACVLAEEMIVEVTADGENDFTIELTPATGEE